LHKNTEKLEEEDSDDDLNLHIFKKRRVQIWDELFSYLKTCTVDDHKMNPLNWWMVCVIT